MASCTVVGHLQGGWRKGLVVRWVWTAPNAFSSKPTKPIQQTNLSTAVRLGRVGSATNTLDRKDRAPRRPARAASASTQEVAQSNQSRLLLHVPSEHHIRQPGLPGTDGQRVCASPCSPSAWMAQTQRPVTGTTRFAAPGLTQLHLRRSAWAPASSDQTPGQGNMQGNVQLHSSGSQPPPERAWLAGPAGGGVSDERRLPIADQ